MLENLTQKLDYSEIAIERVASESHTAHMQHHICNLATAAGQTTY